MGLIGSDIFVAGGIRVSMILKPKQINGGGGGHKVKRMYPNREGVNHGINSTGIFREINNYGVSVGPFCESDLDVADNYPRVVNSNPPTVKEL